MPILAKSDGEVIDGHLRLKGAIAEKMREVRKLQLDVVVGLDLGDAGGGFLNPVRDDADHPDLALFAIYAAGPPAMIAAIRRLFPAQGARAQLLYLDSFDYATDP